jgi:hypothetical protein
MPDEEEPDLEIFQGIFQSLGCRLGLEFCPMGQLSAYASLLHRSCWKSEISVEAKSKNLKQASFAFSCMKYLTNTQDLSPWSFQESGLDHILIVSVLCPR